jgi:hypothetical protein
MPVLSQDNKGETSSEDFFEIRAQVAPYAANQVALVSGLKGVLSIDMPSRSVFARLYESVRQLFQKRYYLG